MVTSSFVNSLGACQEISRTSKSAKNQVDDKFKELMNRKDEPKNSVDKKVSDGNGQDGRMVKDKVDMDDTKDKDVVKVYDGTAEKILSGEITKMLANANLLVTDVNIQDVGSMETVSANSASGEASLEPVEIVNQAGIMVENKVNLHTENLAGENLGTVANGNSGDNAKGRIQLNESFKPVEPTSENINTPDLLGDEREQSDVSEKNIAENLVVNVTQNSGNVGMTRNEMVENSQMVRTPNATFKPEETIDKIAKVFDKEFSQGRREIEIALEPVNLGKITIKVAYDAGKAVISILCSERNLDIISKNSAQLAGILQQYTGDETKVVVEQPQPDYLNQQNEKNDQQREQKYKKDNEKTNDDKETADFLEQLRLGLVKEV